MSISEKNSASPLAPVGPAEDGQKLINFLSARLQLQWGMLQRWIRTGQVRINGRRCRPFDLLHTGDQVRVPPFAVPLALDGNVPEPPLTGDFPPLLAWGDGIWVFDKPGGLAVQGGAKVGESLAGQLDAAYAHCAFVPRPAHRLDRDTSGILLVAASRNALRSLHSWFRNGELRKEYLAVVEGHWPFANTRLLRHYLTLGPGVTASATPCEGAVEALAVAKPLIFGNGHTVMQLRLLTGRKRQLRAQLACEGHPILGDTRYGKAAPGGMTLHSMRIDLPNGMKFSCLPPWAENFGISSLPEPLEITNIRA